VTIPLQTGIVYGPVRSRRLGWSLGVNILPDATKVCNFNCPYCQYGWTPRQAAARARLTAAWPSVAQVRASIDAVLASAVPGRGGHIDRLTLAGNGEPTLHPEFAAIVEALRNVRDFRLPSARTAVLSNGSTVNVPEIAAALSRLDERYMKLDAGDDVTLRKLNGSPVPVDAIVIGLRRLRGVVLQSMFTRDELGKIDNTTEAALDAWVAAIRQIEPLAVHIYTIDRDPAWTPLTAVPREILERIARRVRDAGFDALVF
jgi:wyosine [tRNA(Phe)-imidazoG37] synthetase (radical SAM superfamily)